MQECASEMQVQNVLSTYSGLKLAVRLIVIKLLNTLNIVKPATAGSKGEKSDTFQVLTAYSLSPVLPV